MSDKKKELMDRIEDTVHALGIAESKNIRLEKENKDLKRKVEEITARAFTVGAAMYDIKIEVNDLKIQVNGLKEAIKEKNGQIEHWQRRFKNKVYSNE